MLRLLKAAYGTKGLLLACSKLVQLVQSGHGGSFDPLYVKVDELDLLLGHSVGSLAMHRSHSAGVRNSKRREMRPDRIGDVARG